jgi:hypothetical protein
MAAEKNKRMAWLSGKHLVYQKRSLAANITHRRCATSGNYLHKGVLRAFEKPRKR